MIELRKEVLFVLLILCFLAGTATGYYENGYYFFNGGEYKEEELINLHYIAEISYDGGKMHLENLYLEAQNVDISALEGEEGLVCSDLLTDRLRSKYSEYVSTLMCDNSQTREDEKTEELLDCTIKWNSTREWKYVGEVINSSRAVLETFDFDFVLKTTCFECQEYEDGETRQRCNTYDRFDITLIVPYHEDASSVRGYSIDKNGKRKKVLEFSVSKYKDAVKKTYEEAQ